MTQRRKSAPPALQAQSIRVVVVVLDYDLDRTDGLSLCLPAVAIYSGYAAPALLLARRWLRPTPCCTERSRWRFCSARSGVLRAARE
jgi:hypothetical protein